MKLSDMTNASGFSLVEFLLSLAIISLSALALAGGLSITTDAWTTIVTHKSQTNAKHYLNDRLRQIGETNYMDLSFSQDRNDKQFKINSKLTLAVKEHENGHALVLLEMNLRGETIYESNGQLFLQALGRARHKFENNPQGQTGLLGLAVEEKIGTQVQTIAKVSFPVNAWSLCQFDKITRGCR